MYCTYDVFDLKWIFKKKHIVYVPAFNAQQPNGLYKWFGQPETHIIFDVWLVINCTSTKMVRMPNLAINYAYNGSNFAFPTYCIPIKRMSKVTVQTITVNRFNFAMHYIQYSSITSQLVSNTFQILFIFQCYVLFFFNTFFKNKQKKMDRSYDVAQKKEKLMILKTLAISQSATSGGANFGGK
ncbi:hypothetical protein RFI_25529 [Reticulomyxa filosa]|uniref:Uncharacterized protein n=1 Tax=Reticulomyxa filosa TaxID=46433 RepID=X6MEK7_RETFI|nr:hypothetical protein RFI_25529 [Reticulomyxa filosa]|eukprot:ETO11847.1 hypothetical protein RFI_25529 [Reticulomyxa filosa]